MTASEIDPGGGFKPPSYARTVNKRRFEKLNRNVLEIIMEKSLRNQNVNLTCEKVTSICEMMNIKIESETEGYQVLYRGKYLTLVVWFKSSISIERFTTE